MTPTDATASRPQRRRAPVRLSALACFGLAITATAAAGEPAHTGAVDPLVFPRLTLEIDMNLYGIGTSYASAPRREGFSGFLFGHINPALHLAPNFLLPGLHPPRSGGRCRAERGDHLPEPAERDPGAVLRRMAPHRGSATLCRQVQRALRLRP